jgi:hypothetical protein
MLSDNFDDDFENTSEISFKMGTNTNHSFPVFHYGFSNSLIIHEDKTKKSLPWRKFGYVILLAFLLWFSARIIIIGCASFFQPASLWLDIGWNSLSRVWSITSVHVCSDWWLQDFQDFWMFPRAFDICQRIPRVK